ncbi:hypothetical protein [Klenkia brasiliensis]|uniref:Uncharacterized protein n=1 Tax=Klenkia brasiliensis TaxID=333142 RepID=A0A1G7TIJ1_9ACTN|nr:hypothetical protein [Klenkia brasiliensis]SDG35147.1 hypothetical protein SAMN05660324_2494 [Klenkia brasiliensis]
MDRPHDTISTRTLLWGVVAPLLVGALVPPLAGIATVWLLVGLTVTVVQAGLAAARRADPGEDHDQGDGLHEELAATLPAPVPSSRWWNRTLEDPNVEAARAGSWG